jgi:hypothetical protein
MLKQQLRNQNDLTLQEYIIHYTDQARLRVEKELILNIIFKNIPRVKYLPFDFNWHIKPGFEHVTSAIIKLTGITTELKLHDWNDPMCMHIKNHLIHIFTILQDGLKFYGCHNPPSTSHQPLITKEKLIQLANETNSLSWLSEESEMFVECDI